MRETPKGWAKASLWELVNLRGEKRSPATMPEAQYIGLEHLEPHTSRLLGHVQAGTLKSAGAVFSKGEVLYSRLRPYLNKVWTADRDGLASAEFLVLQSNGSTDMEFIRRRLMTRDFLSFTAGLDKGDRPRVDFEQIGAFQVSLPPLAEQRRIVEKLDALTARTARARADLDRIPALAARYKQAVLAKAFSGELTADWRAKRDLPNPTTARLAQLVSSPIRNGLSVRGSDEPPGVRSLRLSALRGGIVNLADVRFLPISDERAHRFLLQEGDVLVSRGNGTKSLVGISALVSDLCEATIFPDTAFRVRVDQTRVSPMWLSHIWNAPQTRAQIEAVAKTTAGIWKVSQSDLAGIELPYFDLSEQEEIVLRLRSALSDIDRMVTEAAAARRLLDRLDQSVLAKAFRGELVPQDPSDEPASVLLDRIRAERAAAPKAKRGRRKAAA